MSKRKIIWCEVTCGNCGALASDSGYYSPELVKKLKEQTKDWTEDAYYGVLCPECTRKLKE